MVTTYRELMSEVLVKKAAKGNCEMVPSMVVVMEEVFNDMQPMLDLNVDSEKLDSWGGNLEQVDQLIRLDVRYGLAAIAAANVLCLALAKVRLYTLVVKGYAGVDGAIEAMMRSPTLRPVILGLMEEAGVRQEGAELRKVLGEVHHSCEHIVPDLREEEDSDSDGAVDSMESLKAFLGDFLGSLAEFDKAAGRTKQAEESEGKAESESEKASQSQE